MYKKWIVAVAIAGALVFPQVARAHEGHAHKVMGTVSSIEGNSLMVKTTDGKTVMVMLDAKTKITQGKAKVEPSAVKVGDRVVAQRREKNEMVTATTLQLGTGTTPAKK